MNDLQVELLKFVNKFCSHNAGYGTAELASLLPALPARLNARQKSAAVFYALRQLEAAGHVRRLDDKKPIVWGKV